MSKDATIAAVEIAHSPLGASGSGRWMHCPGSIQLAQKLGIHGSESGFAAKEGTAAHEVFARCLESSPMAEPWEFTGTKVTVKGETFEVNQEMVDALNICFNHVMENLAEAEKKGRVLKFIEVSMKHSGHDLMFGTTDCAIVAIYETEFGTLCWIWVNDLKYGAGVVVEPTSSQIKYYAELIVDRLIQDGTIHGHAQVEGVTLTIMQPRIPHHEGIIRSINMTGPELESWYLHELVPAMKATEDPDAAVEMGEWCTFCPVKAHCPAMAQAVFDMSVLMHPEKMTGIQLGDAINKIKAIVKLGSTLEELAFKRALAGEKIKGFKLVKKKSNRQWREFITVKKDGEDVQVPVEEFLKSKFGVDAYSNPTLLTPPQIEKLPGGKPVVTQCAYTPQNTGLTLAPSSDSRVEAKSLMDLADDE